MESFRFHLGLLQWARWAFKLPFLIVLVYLLQRMDWYHVAALQKHRVILWRTDLPRNRAHKNRMKLKILSYLDIQWKFILIGAVRLLRYLREFYEFRKCQYPCSNNHLERALLRGLHDLAGLLDQKINCVIGKRIVIEWPVIFWSILYIHSLLKVAEAEHQLLYFAVVLFAELVKVLSWVFYGLDYSS